MATPQTDAIGRLPGAFELFKQSIALYRSRFWVFLGLSLVLLLILVPIALLVVLLEVTQLPGLLIGILIFVLVLAAIILSPWGQLASILLIREEVRPGFKDLLRRSFPLILPSVWIGALWIAVVMGGLVLLIIPGIILALSLAFVMQALVWDGDRGVAALQRSRFLVAGRWWSVAWRLVFLLLCLILVTIPGELFRGDVRWIGEIYINVVSILAGPLFVIYPTLLYLELKKTRPEKFAPDPGQRKKYLALGALGALALVTISVALAFLIASAAGTGKWLDPDSPAYEEIKSTDYGF